MDSIEYVIQPILPTRGAKGLCMMAGMKIQCTYGGDESTTATECSVLDNCIYLILKSSQWDNMISRLWASLLYSKD
jgi:hypothetical protein